MDSAFRGDCIDVNIICLVLNCKELNTLTEQARNLTIIAQFGIIWPNIRLRFNLKNTPNYGKSKVVCLKSALTSSY